MRGASHLVLCLIAGACYRGPAAPAPAAPDEPLARETEPSALVAMQPAIERSQVVPDIADDSSVTVSGCNTGCADCSLATYKTYVIGRLGRTGEKLFPVEPIEPGYSCSARVKVGETVTLVAHSPSEHFVIESWTPFFARDACPCAGTTAMTCTFVVTPQIAANYDRIYCGANWIAPAARIAH